MDADCIVADVISTLVPPTNYNFSEDVQCCQFNKGVKCNMGEGDFCSTCGWNPVVSEARVKKIRKALGKAVEANL